MTINRTPNSSIANNATPNPRYATSGGFMRASLPSPAPSTASSRAAARLPQPRSKPLIPGSRKEDYARDYVSQRMMHISRRWVKKHGIPDPADTVTGYESMDEVCADMEEVVDVLWFSGTPSIQIPTLLSLALSLNEYLPSFPPSPRPTFSLLQKLDHCFSSLLVGRDVKTNTPLPGFQRGLSAGFSRTDMVRIKSICDETRMQVAVVMSGEADVEDNDEDEPEETIGSRDAAAALSGRVPVTATAQNGHTLGCGSTKPKLEDQDDADDLEIIEDTQKPSDSAHIKPEAEDDEDDEDDEEDEEGEEFIDVEPPTNKRKTHPTTTPLSYHRNPAGEEDDIDQHLADEAKKRIKMESDSSPAQDDVDMTSIPPAADTGSSGTRRQTDAEAAGKEISSPRIKHEDLEPASEAVGTTTSTGAVGGDGAGGFHWTVDDSDSEDDSSTQPALSTTGTTASLPSAQMTSMDYGEDDEDDEEEEELHMNVAKVYEKTLTQLGETLGESIVDEEY